MAQVTGKRRDLEEDEYALEMGEYGKNTEGHWYCRVPAPGFGVGGLGKHDIVEHEDGTITVSPSILCYGHHDNQWHGYLERGVWREV
jgi:hypothetical protein